jgi:hypothetical protein
VSIQWGGKDVKYTIVNQRWLGPILALIFLCPPQAAEACMCMPFPDDFEKAVATAYARADVVFLGDALAMRNTVLGSLQQREVTFSVRDRWKGSTSDTTLVRTNVGEIACGYKFKERNSYLVFAYWDQQLQLLTTSFCDLTRTEAEAKAAIGVLDRLTKRANAAAQHETDHKFL